MITFAEDIKDVSMSTYLLFKTTGWLGFFDDGTGTAGIRPQPEDCHSI